MYGQWILQTLPMLRAINQVTNTGFTAPFVSDTMKTRLPALLDAVSTGSHACSTLVAYVPL
jgi:hypothetical protein